MGATMMDNTRDAETFARSNGQDVYICPECDGRMVLHYRNLPRVYKGVELLLLNFPVIKCLHCEEEIYEAGDLIRFVTQAQQHFDNTGEREFVCLINTNRS